MKQDSILLKLPLSLLYLKIHLFDLSFLIRETEYTVDTLVAFLLFFLSNYLPSVNFTLECYHVRRSMLLPLERDQKLILGPDEANSQPSCSSEQATRQGKDSPEPYIDK